MNETYDGEVPPPWDEPEVAPGAQPAPRAPSCGDSGGEPGAVLTRVREWLARFIVTIDENDLDLLTLWAAHTWLCDVLYTSPRLVIDSPVPESGKTTVVEHLGRLCVRPVQAASLGSPALLARMIDKELRTVLIDEADRVLDPKKEGVGELISIVNSGYKKGGTRPVLVPTKGGEWDVREMVTFAPVAFAGNAPALPEDTMTRVVRVVLMPDVEGRSEESDWELIEPDALALGRELGEWCASVRERVRVERPPLPEGVKGRARERWSPLKRIAVAAGGRWPEVVDTLATREQELLKMDRDDGLVRDKPHVALVRHLYDLWPAGLMFWPTTDMVRELASTHPDMWGEGSPFGKPITATRLGRMLAGSFKVHSTRLERTGPRGYSRASLERAFHVMRLDVAPGSGDTL